jgi:nitroreductase
MSNPIIEAIYQRRSVRDFTDDGVEDEAIQQILDAARWAPSGLNNQPWRFVVVHSTEIKAQLAELTHYSRVVMEAPVLIVVFLDQAASYHRVKDAQAVGACLQNMLLAAHSLGLGAVWLGEILKNAEPVRESVGAPPGLELMAVVALGRPSRTDQTSQRKPLTELIVKRV